MTDADEGSTKPVDLRRRSPADDLHDADFEGAPTRLQWVAAWCLGLLSAALVVAVTRGRMAITADSVTYIDAAGSLRSGHGLRTWLESPLVVFPPVWPVTIALVTVFGLSGQVAALVLVVASVIIIPPLTLALMRRTTIAPVGRMAAVFAAALSPTVLSWAFAGLSEVPFVALVLGCCLLALKSREGDTRLLWAAVALGSLAPLIRYAGVGVPVGLALWLLSDRERPRRLVSAAVAGVAGLVPLGLLAVRNIAAVDAPFGVREPSRLNPVEVVRQSFEGLGRTVLWGLDVAPLALDLLVGLVLVLAIGVGAIRSARNRSTFQYSGSVRSARMLLVILAATQLVVMIGGRARAEIDDLGPRLLAPASILLLLAAFSWLGDLTVGPPVMGQEQPEQPAQPGQPDQPAQPAQPAQPGPAAQPGQRATLRWAAIVTAVIWCVVGLAATVRFSIRDEIKGYEQQRYRTVRTAEVLRSIPPDCRRERLSGDPDTLHGCDVLSNDPWMWFPSPFRPHVSPRNFGAAEEDDLRRLEEAVEDDRRIYLLWTTVSNPKSYLLTPEQLGARVDLRKVGGIDGLSVYRIERKR